tara:strand:- start:797 stop:1024 length:228 start_codon:yes stop_codon:yes gene_type:complete
MGNHPNKTLHIDVNNKAEFAKTIGEGELISKYPDENMEQALMAKYLRQTRVLPPFTRATYPHSITVWFNGENTHE